MSEARSTSANWILGLLLLSCNAVDSPATPPAEVEASPQRAQNPLPSGPPSGSGRPHSFAPPSQKAIQFAHSADGTHFVLAKIPRILRASTPELAFFDAEPTVFYVRQGPGHPIAKRRLDSDAPELGVDLGPKCRGGVPNEHGPTCVDPDIVQLEDGTWRMYYVLSEVAGDPALGNHRNQIVSARSSDGETWQVEEGVRFVGKGIADPDIVALPNGGWRMYYTLASMIDEEGTYGPPGARHASIFSALSTDGLEFRDEGISILVDVSVSSTHPSNGGGWRMYVHTRDTFVDRTADANDAAYVVSATSNDGKHFVREEGARIPRDTHPGGGASGAESPSLAQAPDGTLWMAFVTVMDAPDSAAPRKGQGGSGH